MGRYKRSKKRIKVIPPVITIRELVEFVKLMEKELIELGIQVTYANVLDGDEWRGEHASLTCLKFPNTHRYSFGPVIYWEDGEDYAQADSWDGWTCHNTYNSIQVSPNDIQKEINDLINK